MDEYYTRDLYPRMLRHLEKYGDVGAWRKMSRCFAISHYVKTKWNNLTGNHPDGNYPNRDEILELIHCLRSDVEPIVGKESAVVFVNNCEFILSGEREVKTITMHKDQFWYSLRKLKGLNASKVVAALIKMAERIAYIEREVDEISDKALTNAIISEPALTVTIPDSVLLEVTDLIIEEVVGYGNPYNMDLIQKKAYFWIARIFIILLLNIKRDYPEGFCVHSPKLSEVVDTLYNSGLVFVRKDDETIDAGGIKYILGTHGGFVYGIWVASRWEEYINLNYGDTGTSLPSLHVLKQLAEMISVNQELIIDTCIKAYEKGNKELIIRKIQNTVKEARKKETTSSDTFCR